MLAGKQGTLTNSKATINRSVRIHIGSGLARVLWKILAGMIASKDYRHLVSMSDRQLGQLGLTRNSIPDELHRRHFAGLAGWPANAKRLHPRRE